ncbi:hypothetical protein [Carboxylicivirga marina]|uniref:Uncharacterized protein n=1 Tax=Carboxylicivirga marina TaxID=2800988 RepID=A0ABS1HME8_9BACT|nr:hypothetical protein [Carboxylicivirga marina]MBK3518868.1 hypothetical protein [Carboxylicivirga marina]
MIIALLISLFFGGGQDDFMMPPIEKYAKRNLDNVSKTIVLEGLDSYEAEAKEFYKKHHKRVKSFQKQRLRKDLKKEQFDAFFAKRISGFKTLDSLSNVRRKTLKAEFTPQQWKESVKDIDKTIEKHEKSFVKKRKQLDKRFNKLHNKVEKMILKKGMNPSAKLIIKSFEEHLNYTLDAFVAKRKELNNHLIKYDSSDEEMLNIRNEIIQIRIDFNEQFKKTYFDLTHIMTDKEWKMIRSQFNKIL